jgi:hypothetical protein
MALSNLLILGVASVALVLCGIITGRLLQEEQEIYLGKKVSRREVFRLTLLSSFFIVAGLYFGILIFFVVVEPSHTLTASDVLSLLCFPLAVFPIGMIGSYYSYFVVGKYRDWLFSRLRKPKR